MSENNCDGGIKCSCGCPEGNCICGEKSTFEEGISILLDIVAESPMPLQAKVLIGFLYEYGMFLKFAFEEAALIKRETELYNEYIKACLSPESDKCLIAEANLEAFKAARQIRNQREHALREAEAPDKVARAVTTMFAPLIRAAGQGISADEITARLKKSLEDCGCCGDDDKNPQLPPKKTPVGEPVTTGRHDPFAFDLNGDGKIATVNVDDSNVFVDVDNDKLGERIGWVGKDDGILFYDKNTNGKFDGTSELFGASGQNGFDELAGYDINGDGVINSKDAIYSKLQVWQDLNGDGKIQDGEVKSLTDWGIDAINLKHNKTDIEDENGNHTIATGSYIKDGKEYVAASLDMSVNNTSSIYVGDVEISKDAQYLPFMWGFGDVPASHVSLTLDEKFCNIVTDKLLGVSVSESFMNADELLYYWSGLYKVHEKYGVIRDPQNLTVGDKMWIYCND